MTSFPLPFFRPLRVGAMGVAVVVVMLAAVAGCSSDDDASTTTASTSSQSTGASNGSDAETIRFDEEIQQELADVGCHPGAVDGVLGPHTDAAVLAFQQGAGLSADGVLGPDTESALARAAEAGETVCTGEQTTTTSSDGTTTVPSGGEASCTATAVSEGLPDEGETIAKYICSEGYAAGSLSDGTRFVLESEGGRWYTPSQDPCGTASAGIPAEILSEGCGS